MSHQQNIDWEIYEPWIGLGKHTNSKVESTIARTFAWVWATMLVAALVAYMSASGLLPFGYSSTWAMIAWVASLAMIFGMNRIANSVSYPILAGFLLFFWALQWYGLAWVLLSYSIGAIYQAFMWASVMFFLLAIVWYYTKIDITRWWPILFWSMIAWFITMLLNMFLIWSGGLNIRMSLIGIVIFSGFIIYDMNILTQKATSMDKKIELLIALGLFISFMNIFQMLLSLGGRD